MDFEFFKMFMSFFWLIFKSFPVSKIIVERIFFPPEITPYFIAETSKDFFCFFIKDIKNLSIFLAFLFNLFLIIKSGFKN